MILPKAAAFPSESAKPENRLARNADEVRPRGTLARSTFLGTVLVMHIAILLWMAWANSPVHNEAGHLAAGLSHCKFGNFILFRVNPPLVRMLAAIPVLAVGAESDWSAVDDSPFARPEFASGARFVEINGTQVFWLFTLARWGCIPLSVLGAWTCYRWSTELYGSWSGLVALCLWCFCTRLRRISNIGLLSSRRIFTLPMITSFILLSSHLYLIILFLC